MFAFDRSAVAVLAPLALLVGVVLWSNMASRNGVGTAVPQQSEARQESPEGGQTVAANLPSR